MTKQMWVTERKQDGRVPVNYEDGEIPAQYGLARESHDGTLEFLCEHTYRMSWEKKLAQVRPNPPVLSGYVTDTEDYRYFSVNFRSDKSPVILAEQHKRNRRLKYK